MRDDVAAAMQPDYDDCGWETVDLPHSFNHEKFEIVGNGFRGVGWYRRRLSIASADRDRRLVLYFEGAMTVAEVWINGVPLPTHHGGYTPFCHDIGEHVRFGESNVIALRLDNRYQPEVPPERPDERPLGMAHNGGLYRSVYLLKTDPLHIPEAIHGWDTGWQEQGGVFIHFPTVSRTSAVARIVTWVKNSRPHAASVRVLAELIDVGRSLVGSAVSEVQCLEPGENRAVELSLTIADPQLWFPWEPSLYTVHTGIVEGEGLIDGIETRTGIRSCEWKRDEGFFINGQHLKLLGANRHQHFPFIGHAVPKNQQRLDAVDIRNAGCNCVRHSHYLQDDAFMEACDELGLISWVELPGWGTHGLNPGEVPAQWRQRNRDGLRATIRHARNHPSIVIWGAGINEARQDETEERELHKLARAEDPTRPTSQARNYNTENHIFDIYARNDYGVLNTSNPDPKTHGYLITEHSSPDRGKPPVTYQHDWKETGNNYGWCYRDADEARLLTAVTHLMEYLAYVYRHPWIAGAMIWEMYDHYTQFYSPRCHGISDAGRIPKWHYYLYQSQSAHDNNDGAVRPMVFVANQWSKDSPTDVVVLSNCQQVRLSTWHGKAWRVFETRQPEDTPALPHPPFRFELKCHDTPQLLAEGLINGQVVAHHLVREPGRPFKVQLQANTHQLRNNGADMSLLTVSIVDAHGTVVPDARNTVRCTVQGPGTLIGENPLTVHSGQFPILFQAGRQPGLSRITAESAGILSAMLDLDCNSGC